MIGRFMLATFLTCPTKCGLISQSGPSFHATCCAPTGWPTNRYSISLRQSTNTACGFFCRNSWASLGLRCFMPRKRSTARAALRRAAVVACLALAACGERPETAYVADLPRADPSAIPASPRLALVLSGGGPRGFAHIGVLKVLAEAGIRPDLVVGTSSGALVGVLYAARPSPAELEKRALALGGADVFDYDVFRQRVSGSALQSWIDRAVEGRTIDRLTLPVVVVATRQADGASVAFTRGDSGAAVRASSAVPGSFSPVRIGEDVFVDGDISAPLPIAIARGFGAKRVIAVDVAQDVSRAPAPAN